MSWASNKAREICDAAWESGEPVPAFIERAIRETIERCAEVAEEGRSETLFESMAAIRVSQAIRKLGEEP